MGGGLKVERQVDDVGRARAKTRKDGCCVSAGFRKTNNEGGTRRVAKKKKRYFMINVRFDK